jgi:hypothetical protein
MPRMPFRKACRLTRLIDRTAPLQRMRWASVQTRRSVMPGFEETVTIESQPQTPGALPLTSNDNRLLPVPDKAHSNPVTGCERNIAIRYPAGLSRPASRLPGASRQNILRLAVHTHPPRPLRAQTTGPWKGTATRRPKPAAPAKSHPLPAPKARPIRVLHLARTPTQCSPGTSCNKSARATPIDPPHGH